MLFTKSQRAKIRRKLPKNLRQKIVEKCTQNGNSVTVRQVSLVLDNHSKDEKLIKAVCDAISQLLEENERKMKELKEGIPL